MRQLVDHGKRRSPFCLLSFHSRYVAGGETRFRFSTRREVPVSKSSCVVRDLESLFPSLLTSVTAIRKGQQPVSSRSTLNLGCPYHIGRSTIKHTATRLPQTSPIASVGAVGVVPSLSNQVPFFLRIMINNERSLSHYFIVLRITIEDVSTVLSCPIYIPC